MNPLDAVNQLGHAESLGRLEDLPADYVKAINDLSVVVDLLNIVNRGAWRSGILVLEEVGQGRLRALDLRGQQRLLADVHVEEERGVGQDGGHSIEPADRAVRALELTVEPIHPHRRGRRALARRARPSAHAPRRPARRLRR